jgi:hypothetical protein
MDLGQMPNRREHRQEIGSERQNTAKRKMYG